MGYEREVLQTSSDYMRVPWQWRDPWCWVTLVLFILGLIAIFSEFRRIYDGLSPTVPLMLSMAADSWRKAAFLGRAGAQPSQVNGQRLWAIAFLSVAAVGALLTWDSAPWN